VRVPVLAAAVCVLPVLAFPQSLGDAARREEQNRERKRATGVKAPSYSQADLSPLPDEPESPATPAEASREAEEEAPSTGPTTEDATRVRKELDREAARRQEQERYWRQQATSARTRLDAAQRTHDVVCGPGVLALTGG